MQYRRFGRTELSMPVFSCGGMRYQQSWTDQPLSEIEQAGQQNLEATIRRSVELGINHIETARGYGSSERQLGVVLPQLPREELIVQTKVAPEADPELFRKHCLESLERLKLDYVDLLGLHGINTYELLWQAMRPGGCLQVARELQAEGKVRHVGFSTHGSLELILDTIRQQNHGGFDYVNLHWYYIYQHNWPAIQAAAERDMGVFIISPSNKGGMLYQPPEKLVQLCRPLHPLVFNCLFCLARPEVHTLSLGASCPSDFDLQMSSLPMLKQAAAEIAPVVQRLQAEMVSIMGEDYVRTSLPGLPAWEATPGYINLPIVLWLRSLALAYDMTEYGKMRYNLLGNGEHWFPGQGAGHLATLDQENLAKSFAKCPSAEKIMDWLQETDQLLGGEAVKRLSQSD